MILIKLACPQSIVNTDYSTKPCVQEIKINNQLVNDQNIIAQKFNEYFVSIGPNLAEKIDIVNDAPDDAVNYISGHYKNRYSSQKPLPVKY